MKLLTTELETGSTESGCSQVNIASNHWLALQYLFTVTILSFGSDRPRQTVKTRSDQNVSSDHGVHCLPFIQQYLRYIKGQCNGLFQI